MPPEPKQIRAALAAAFPTASLVSNRSIAVLLPCYNEAATVAEVVRGFSTALPGAKVYVYDNNSTDETAAEARRAGAVVRRERRQGKGHVVRRMFADIDADVYLLADGDLTYDPTAAGRLIDAVVTENVDMAVGVRISQEKDAFRFGHRFGNQLFNTVVAKLFGEGFTDILSGYRAFSRRFAKSFPAASGGFEIETELTVHALDLQLACIEIPLPYGSRPQNSTSKLRTYRDGARIMWAVAKMYRALHPFRFYGALAGLVMLVALALGTPIVAGFMRTGLVPRLPTAVLAMGLAQLSFLCFGCGLVLNAVASGRRELKRMRYLDLSAPS